MTAKDKVRAARQRMCDHANLLETERGYEDVHPFFVEFDAAITALEDELAISKHLNAKWMDEKTEALIRADRAEAELAAMTKERQFLLDYTTGERERKALKRAEQAESDLAIWRQAVGLASTAVPDMEIDITDPIGMMQRVVAEQAAAQAKDREHYESWKKDMAAWRVDRDRAKQAEAELAKRRTESTNDEVLVEEYRAELAALRARRCETCNWLEPGVMDPDSCEVLQGFIPCKGFACNRWTPREDA